MEPIPAQVEGTGVSAQLARTYVGSEVSVDCGTEHLEGTLLSATDRSLWIVAGDVDHLVAMPRVVALTRT